MNKSYATIGPSISAGIRTLPRWLAAVVFGVTVLSASQALAAPTPVVSWQKQADGVTFRLQPGVLKVQVWTPRVIRVQYGPGTTLPLHRSLSVIAMPRPVPWHLVTTPQAVTLTTGAVEAQVDRSTGAVRFLNAHGTPILSETPGGRALTPVTLAGPTPEAAYRSQQSFATAGGRGHLRPGTAPAADEPGQHELSRHVRDAGAGQPRGRHPVPGLQPGLRPALGQSRRTRTCRWEPRTPRRFRPPSF